jgi:hypothetical protein
LYKPIETDRENLTITGVIFPDLATLNSVSDAIGSNKFEGFEPTPKSVAIIRDYIMGEITPVQLAQMAKDKAYV